MIFSGNSRLFTIPAGQPFAQTLATGLLKQSGDNPLALADWRILLPTRRACRNLRDAFLRLTEGQPLLLPQMHPIGDIEEDDLTIEWSASESARDMLDLPPAMPPLRRNILLARLIMGMKTHAKNPGQALALAEALGRLIDQIYIEERNIEDLATLVPEDFAQHWKITIDFLKILSEAWPAILEENGAIDAADRRGRLIDTLCTHWQRTPPQTPVIAAGSTGSIPATARLLKTITNLPQGCVVLPGFDREMDKASWDTLDAHHPQATLKQLLERLEHERSNVHDWPYTISSTTKTALHQDKQRWLAREMMRPAATTQDWQTLSTTQTEKEILIETLKNIQRYDCDTAQEEATLIACLMRETLEHPGRTATLITPDRSLARRVATVCQRWGIELDDSGGRPLNTTPRAGLLRLSVQTALSNLQPRFLLSLLKHEHCRVIDDISKINALEKTLLRGPTPSPGFEGLYAALKEDEKQQQELSASIAFLEQTYRPFITLCSQQTSLPFSTFLDAHITLIETLGGGESFWSGDDGEELALLLAELGAHAAIMPPVNGTDYLSIIEQIMSGITIRPAYGMHPRLAILGQLEARLGHADLLILGGLNEGTWPPEPPADPWLSRPMRTTFGLPAPERMIGLAAHDFVQKFCAPRVILTRARRIDSAPTVPSRWLARLDTVLQATDINPETLSRGPHLSYTRQLDKVKDVRPYERPAPCPPLESRPTQLSVTAIEKWMRDPYSIYARYVLGLKKLNDLEQDTDAAVRGTLIHDVLEEFIKDYPAALPEDATAILKERGHEKLRAYQDTNPALPGFWEPRFDNLADWFITHEQAWRNKAKPCKTEIEGHMTLGSFTLTAKADRIDKMTDGTLAIIDYKTGNAPQTQDVQAGFSPQIPLEGAIALSGGFDGLPPATLGYLGFWNLSGGNPPGKETPIKAESYETLCREAQDGLETLITTFADPATPYYSLPRPDKAAPRQWQDYAHLARVQEWTALEDEEGVA